MNAQEVIKTLRDALSYYAAGSHVQHDALGVATQPYVEPGHRAAAALAATANLEQPVPLNWCAPKDVDHLIRQLHTADPTMPVHGAIFVEYKGERKARIKPLCMSLERVATPWIKQGDASVPYSLVIWSAVHEQTAEAAIKRDDVAGDENASSIEKRMEALAKPFESYLTEDDFHDLHRFMECCEDSESGGHDVPKNRMRRLTEIGVVRSCGFGRHEATAFGCYVHDGVWLQSPELPLKTMAERIERATITTSTHPGCES